MTSCSCSARVSDYVITASSGAVVRASVRSPGVRQQVQHVLRSLLSRFATPRTELSLCDGEGTHRLDIVSEPGNRADVDLTVTRPDGELVGTVTASGGIFRAFPTISLLDGAGAPVGHLTTQGAPHAYDVADRKTAVVVLGTTRPVFGKLVYELTFVGNVPTQSRVLIVAGLIGWDLSR
jgi:hypothetical protein